MPARPPQQLRRVDRHPLPVNGARGALIGDFANRRRCGQLLSPRLRGEMPGRAMRGSANVWEQAETAP
ncbi:MAG: hypothetical protein EOS27_32210 [Mesorhizobium sp.]|nr:MAG: hypothetical protein EOS27_32210 [Mesorhizobium sp.]